MVPVDHAGLPSGDAMSYGADATELLDVELDGRTELLSPRLRKTRLTVGVDMPSSRAICLPVELR
jgi:hypothetical protein